MRRQIICFFCCIGSIVYSFGQNATETDSLCPPKLEIKTFIVRKTVEPPLEFEELSPKEPVVTVRSRAVAPIPRVQPPSLARDEKGLSLLVTLEPYNEKMTMPPNVDYVIFLFSISKKGNVAKIEIYDTNNLELVDVIAYKLNYTQWNPAQTIEGEYVDYTFDKWIAILPPTTTKEDYENHRY